MSHEERVFALARAAVAPLAAEIRALTQELRELNAWRGAGPPPRGEAGGASSVPMLTPKQVASRLGVSPSMVRGLVRKGRLRSLRVGRLPRFREEDVQEYVDSAGEE